MGIPGKFIVFEGVDHSGKTTQIDLAEKWLLSRGYKVARFREPGGTPAGERIRGALLDKELSIVPLCEMLLFMASRVQLLEQKIIPALNNGEVVLLDRYWFSTYAYQGIAGHLGGNRVTDLVFLLGLRYPDLVVMLDGDPELLASRHHGASDRIEAKGLQYQREVRDGYHQLALTHKMKHLFRVVDAEKPLEDVHTAIVDALSKANF
jgi:dTMP kinase